MNATQRQQYAEKHDRRMKLFERRFIRPVFNALQQQMKESSEILQRSGVDGLKMVLESLVFVQDLAQPISDIYKSAGIYFANKTLRDINASVREVKAGFGFDEKWNQLIIDYLRQNLLTRAVLPISQTTKQQVLRILEQGQNEGWGIDKMAFELENSGLTLSRARMIVRTELTMAMNLGKELGRQESPYETTKMWIAAKDHRTRHSHREVDSEMIDVGAKFNVKRYKGDKMVGWDKMTGPGDPKAHPENIINCRCTTVERVKRDENGRPILKRKISVILPAEVVRTRREVITI